MKAYESEIEVSSMLDIKKEQAAELKSDFTFELQGITRHQAAKMDGELFAKVYGENNVKNKADFRAKVKAEIEANMAEDSKYKFGLDAKAAIVKKMEKVEMPEAFLRRWVKTTNDKMTDEELDRFQDYPSDAYTEEEVEEFHDVLYTMKSEEVAGWVRSLQLRHVNLPDEVKDEVFLIIGERRTQ